ncbi:MAG TPA: flavin reductase family protein [Longimicrobiales bacterium]
MLDTPEFRRVLGHWPTGVAIVTTRTAEGRACGLTANSFTSLSLEPLLVLVCVEKSADTHDCVLESKTFAVNILPSDCERLARRFAAWEVERKFDGVSFREELTGAPILNDALAWVDCRLHSQIDGGDHTIFIGAVLAGDAKEGTPLLYYRGGYGRLTP